LVPLSRRNSRAAPLPSRCGSPCPRRIPAQNAAGSARSNSRHSTHSGPPLFLPGDLPLAHGGPFRGPAAAVAGLDAFLRVVAHVESSFAGDGMGKASLEGARPGRAAVVPSVTCPVTPPGRPATGRSVDSRSPTRYRVGLAVSALDHGDRR